MASNYTENFGLCQWEATDQVLRTEFNEDNTKIDMALAAIPTLVAGTYVGNGSASQTISLGFTPKAVFFSPCDGKTYVSVSSGYIWGGLVIFGSPLKIDTTSAASIITGGFVVFQKSISNYSGVYCNKSEQTYYYIAFA